MTERKVQAVVWDVGGVLQRNPGSVRNRLWKELCGIAPSDQTFDPLWKKIHGRLMIGREPDVVDVAQLNTLTGENLNDFPNTHLMDALRETTKPNEEALALVRELREDEIRQVICTNTTRLFSAYNREIGIYDGFSDQEIVESYKVGFRKPQRSIFEIVIARLQLPPSGIIFVDDKRENLEQAEKLGMSPHLYRNPRELRNAVLL